MIDVRRALPLPGGERTFYSLPELARRGFPEVARLPVSLRIMLESLLRNLDGRRVRDEDVEALARWRPGAPRTAEVPFVVARVLLQDFTGVPLLVDLAAMRAAVARRGGSLEAVQPSVPVDLVIDHSVQVDYQGTSDALEKNLQIERERNRERYRFLDWGARAFDGLRVLPPGFGICHQVNLEYLARGVVERGAVCFPDTLVGTDSHTTMINGLGVLGWGVGGIEAEAAMLGQPVYLLAPDVVGVHLGGSLRDGATATDLVLAVTELLRHEHVVGKFVEFFGEGAASLSVPDRATVSNMAPEYGATIGLFAPDERACRYLAATGRSEREVEVYRRYFEAQGLFGAPRRGQIDYSAVIDLDLGSVRPSVAGPKRPQDRIALGSLGTRFRQLLARTDGSGYGLRGDAVDATARVRSNGDRVGRPGGGDQLAPIACDGQGANTNPLTETEMMNNRPTPDPVVCAPLHEGASMVLRHGSVVIAAITSCTNTSNPSVMVAAGLVAKRAAELGLCSAPWVKTSLAPGSRVVTAYLARAGLTPYLDRLGFQTVGYGCTTCIGNSGPLAPEIETAIDERDLVVASVLSGNRNFEARIHQAVRANFLMSPPLVVAFAIAGRIDIDLDHDALAVVDGRKVYLRDLWPTPHEIARAIEQSIDPGEYRRVYAPLEERSRAQSPPSRALAYSWDAASTYIREPPYFIAASPDGGDVRGARALAIFGDSVTTDHISPAGAIKPTSPAGCYLRSLGIAEADFNSYGARRGNHEVMVRGTFANVRIRNLMVPGVEGGVTAHLPDGARMSIFEAAMSYADEKVPLLVIAGADYGAGSSRDWAAKGTRLLGVRAVIARSFERIHRSNLVGMGVLPCQLPDGVSAQTLALDGSERFDLVGLTPAVRPRQRARLSIQRASGARDEVEVTVRIDTPIEADHYRSGGILPYLLARI